MEEEQKKQAPEENMNETSSLKTSLAPLAFADM